jgi:hypothetical protein
MNIIFYVKDILWNIWNIKALVQCSGEEGNNTPSHHHIMYVCLPHLSVESPIVSSLSVSCWDTTSLEYVRNNSNDSTNVVLRSIDVDGKGVRAWASEWRSEGVRSINQIESISVRCSVIIKTNCGNPRIDSFKWVYVSGNVGTTVSAASGSSESDCWEIRKAR